MVKRLAIAALLGALALAAHGPERSSAAQAPAAAKRTAAKAQPAGSTVLNVQIVELDAASSVLRVHSTGPQAFDRLKAKNPRQVLVRLYRARLGDLPPFDQPSFGSVSLSESGGNVLLTIDLASTLYTAAVSQGGNPDIIEVRVRH